MTKSQEAAIARVCAHECLMGELVEALERIVVSANTVGYCYTKHPGNFAAALRDMKDDAEKARAVLARAKEQA